MTIQIKYKLWIIASPFFTHFDFRNSTNFTKLFLFVILSRRKFLRLIQNGEYYVKKIRTIEREKENTFKVKLCLSQTHFIDLTPVITWADQY